MKIAIDARLYDESGIGRYIRNLLRELQDLDTGNEYFILLLKKEYLGLNFSSKSFKKVLADIKWYGFAEQLKIPPILKSLNVDLVHFPHFNVPLGFKGNFVVTIHDLIHQNFSMQRSTSRGPLIYKIKRYGYNKVFNHAINKSLKIFVPSNFVKGQLIREWQIEDKRIVVTHEAVDDKVFTLAGKMEIKDVNKVMEKFKIHSPYIFYVGNAHPHKNVEGLIKAYINLKRIYPSLTLVLSGHDHYFWQRIKKENTYDGIIYTEFITDEELVCLYKNATCFVMPSLEEGFGIPLLEGMACGCPVVSSNAGSLKEVGGDAALYFDPRDISDMTDKITKILSDKNLRNSLIESGRRRTKFFSWEELAKQTQEVYQRCGLH